MKMQEDDYMGDNLQYDAWEFDTEKKIHNLTWWWWFWLFIFKNKENPKYPRQLALILSTRDCDSLKVNGLPIDLQGNTTEKGSKTKFPGAVGAWYYDGRKMLENFVLEGCDITAEPNKMSTDSKNCCAFSNNGGGRYGVSIKKDATKFDFNLSMPKDNAFAQPRLGGKYYLGTRFGYSKFRLNKLDLKGRIANGARNEKIDGIGYFQKVRLNAPALPWYWGIVYFENGSMLSYFNPYANHSILHRRIEEPSERYNALTLPLSKVVRFYDHDEDKLHIFKNVKISKQKNARNLPLWTVKGKNKSERVDFTLDSYSRACWKFERKPFGLPLSTTLHYNEYPVIAKKFSYDGEKHLRLKDLGNGVGNSEHTWGMLL